MPPRSWTRVALALLLVAVCATGAVTLSRIAAGRRAALTGWGRSRGGALLTTTPVSPLVGWLVPTASTQFRVTWRTRTGETRTGDAEVTGWFGAYAVQVRRTP